MGFPITDLRSWYRQDVFTMKRLSVKPITLNAEPLPAACGQCTGENVKMPPLETRQLTDRRSQSSMSRTRAGAGDRDGGVFLCVVCGW